MSISTDLYRTFLGVGLHLSFSKAAKDLGVSQSAISQSIKQLEKELEITLFERTTKSVAFTPEGKELFDTVAKAFSILDNGVTQLQERMTHEQESLKLAATDTLCRHFLLPYFKKWQEQEHDTGLQITNRPSPQCVEMVENREAQIAIVNTYEGLELNPQLEVIDLLTVQDIFVGGPFYKGMGVIDLNRLLQEPLLLLTQGAASRSFFDQLTNNACKKPSFELGSLDVLMDLVEINMGISLVPDMLVKQKIKEGRVVEIKTDMTVPPRKVALVRSRLMPVSQGAAKFIDLLLRK
ncbi:LysR family transcriptional regulator [uncultured Veillonella sp.]|uniref:LysR family transcriptional regulator n=1 Tax=uncultured Veillonella sp. TaxID=159268 RepID=UPI0025E8EB4E|nr:LysR family transcriptional regulator [uncultured Veillonella sp.]MDY3973987.1 LysR family transcriptional regulator [Veillonella caviae]